MVILGLALCRMAARVILLPDHYLAAGVVLLAVFGTYSVQNSYSDVLIMVTLGTAPLVLGIVLGPIAEENFVYGYTIATAGGGGSTALFPRWTDEHCFGRADRVVGSERYYPWAQTTEPQTGGMIER